MITAVAELLTEIVRGQPAETKRQMWEWFIEDQKRWRTFLKMDD